MLYQTTIPAGGPKESELRSLVEQLSRISGAPIEMELQLCISTESVEMSNILDSLADSIRNGKPAITRVRANGHQKKARKPKAEKSDGPKPEPTRGPHVRSIKILVTGEMISRFELDRRLKEREIDPGTGLHSPKHGNMVVTKQDGSEELYLMNELGERL